MSCEEFLNRQFNAKGFIKFSAPNVCSGRTPWRTASKVRILKERTVSRSLPMPRIHSALPFSNRSSIGPTGTTKVSSGRPSQGIWRTQSRKRCEGECVAPWKFAQCPNRGNRTTMSIRVSTRTVVAPICVCSVRSPTSARVPTNLMVASVSSVKQWL